MDQFMPVVAVNGPWVHVIWYDTRRMWACPDEPHDIDLYYAFSDDYGAEESFTEIVLEEPAIRPLLLHDQAPNENTPGFIGDYNGIAVNNNNVVVPVYMVTPVIEAEPPPGGEGMQGDGGECASQPCLTEAVVSRRITFTE